MNVIYDRVFYNEERFEIKERERIIKDIQCFTMLIKSKIKEKGAGASMIYNSILFSLSEFELYLSEIIELPDNIRNIIRTSRQIHRLKRKIHNISAVMKNELFFY